MDLKILFGCDCCGTEASVPLSTIQHARAENGVFANRKFGEKGVAGSYYQSLECGDLARELRRKKQYKEETAEVISESFRKLAVKLEGKVSNSRVQKYFVWVISALLCAMRYMNESQ